MIDNKQQVVESFVLIGSKSTLWTSLISFLSHKQQPFKIQDFYRVNFELLNCPYDIVILHWVSKIKILIFSLSEIYL